MRGMAIPVLLAQLRVAEVKIVAASSRVTADGGELAGVGADLREAVAIFIGNEGSGVAAGSGACGGCAHFDSDGGEVESLNAGMAASIVLYEAATEKSHHR